MEQNGKRAEKSELKIIIEEVTKKNNFDVDKISPLSIRHQVDRQSLECCHLAGGQVSHFAEIESVVVGIILQMAQIWLCLNLSKGLTLVNSVIEGTREQDDLKKLKQKRTTSNHT